MPTSPETETDLRVAVAVLKSELVHIVDTLDRVIDIGEREQLIVRVAVIEEKIEELEDKIEKINEIVPLKASILSKVSLIGYFISGVFSIVVTILAFFLKSCGS